MWQTYHHATSFEEAANLLAQNPNSSRIIAGGTDLLVEMRNGLRKDVDTLIDISRIPNTGKIWMDENRLIHLDACVTHSDCVASELLGKYAKPLVQACHAVGSPQIRNRGTVVGNLVTASPANDAITPLMALGAKVHLLSNSGARIVSLMDFYLGVRKTELHSDEILTEVSFPALPEKSKSVFLKHALRNAQAISLLNCTIIARFDHEIIQSASITLGAVAPIIIHAEKAQEAVVGKRLVDLNPSAIGQLAELDASPITDLRSSSEYRQAMVKVLVQRGLESFLEDDRENFIKPAVLWGQSSNPLHNADIPKITQDEEITCKVNGVTYHGEYQPGMTLLQFLRDKLRLTGSKAGCEEGECGACTIHLDGAAVLACLTPAERAQGAEIITIEGLEDEEGLNSIQQAFVDEGAVQCGFCTPGFIMSATKLLEENPHPKLEEIKEAISGNLCRCTGYYKIISAIEKVAAEKNRR